MVVNRHYVMTTADTIQTTDYDSGTGDRREWTRSLLETSEKALRGQTNTATKHLTADLDLRDQGIDTGRVGITFMLQLPNMSVHEGDLPGGFDILRLGAGGSGTLTLKYIPVAGSTKTPHMLVAEVIGDTSRKVTVTPSKLGFFIKVFLEYNGSDLLLVAGDSSDSYHATTKLDLPAYGAPGTPFMFAADATDLAFDDLTIYNTALTAESDISPTGFPFILWDNADSGVIATLPVTSTPGEVVTFVDRGFTAGHLPASIDLTTAQTFRTGSTSVTLYVNEKEIPLTGFTGTTVAALVTWLTTFNGGVHTFKFDGKTETIKFSVVSGNTITAQHIRGAVVGQLSFSIRFEGVSGSGTAITGTDWSKTYPILGKIPQQFYLPHTGMINEGISIMGCNKQVTSPRSLKVSRRDDAIRTVGKIIGSVKNRPTSRSMLEALDPIPFFGADQAPYPAGAIVWGTPGKIGTALPPETSYCYGMTWNRFLMNEPGKVSMIRAPNQRSRAGDTFAGFSLDIPYGKLLRGLNLNFVTMPPALVGNIVPDADQKFDWGIEFVQFPMSLQGNADYTALFYLMIAVDNEATMWRPLPSLGGDAVKVSGANTWKEIAFRTVDYQTLVDVDGRPLLQGSRRVHFKMVLANELTAVTYTGLSYFYDTVPKK